MLVHLRADKAASLCSRPWVRRIQVIIILLNKSHMHQISRDRYLPRPTDDSLSLCLRRQTLPSQVLSIK